MLFILHVIKNSGLKLIVSIWKEATIYKVTVMGISPSFTDNQTKHKNDNFIKQFTLKNKSNGINKIKLYPRSAPLLIIDN